MQKSDQIEDMETDEYQENKSAVKNLRSQIEKIQDTCEHKWKKVDEGFELNETLCTEPREYFLYYRGSDDSGWQINFDIKCTVCEKESCVAASHICFKCFGKTFGHTETNICGTTYPDMDLPYHKTISATCPKCKIKILYHEYDH